MCGIAGIVSTRGVAPRLYSSILKLEYRGYDSCGMVMVHGGELVWRKNIGKIAEANRLESFEELPGSIGIAHTRWATHGGVTQVNSHPHLSSRNEFALVHNGIISNYREIRARMEATGRKFRSETDTETVVMLLEFHYDHLGNIEEALRKTISELQGTYAVAVLTSHEPGTIYCARKESPLLIGVGSNEMFLGSDINAFIEHTRQMVPLIDGEYAILTAQSYVIKEAATGNTVQRQVETITWSPDMSEKGGFPHFMLKEIHEQPHSLRNVASISEGDLEALVAGLCQSQRSYLVGVGTTFYVALTGQYYFKMLADRYIPAVYSDEFANLVPSTRGDLVLAVSQSGETYDTLSALRYAKARGATTGAIINAVGSSMSREVDYPVLQGSGPEICVLSTKAAMAQMFLLIRLALLVGLRTGFLSKGQFEEHQRDLAEFPQVLNALINGKAGHIHQIARDNVGFHNWLYMGRGVYHAIALEAALKMKEVTYLHAEGMPAGFLKHGNIAMIDEKMVTLAFVPPPGEHELHQAMMSNVEEVRARNGKVIGVHFAAGDPAHGKRFDQEILLPEAGLVTSPLCQLVVGQLLAYHTAKLLKRDPDKPRSLAKSVTVP